jgi:3',5'-nucleoside bisphosphate phosphatase
MKIFKADLHIHTVLSPCGELEMSPRRIVQMAKQKNLDIIGISDHNSTRHGNLIKKLGEQEGIFVLTGAEVTTREEVHCLTFFEYPETLEEFQLYIKKWLPPVKNKPSWFGYQVVVDESENILDEEPYLLISGLNQSITEVRNKVAELNGLFIPAHINRPNNSIFSQLGFLPEGLNPDAIEIDARTTRRDTLARHPELSKYTLLKDSDSHMLERIGAVYNQLSIEKPSFEEIRKALHRTNGREVIYND